MTNLKLKWSSDVEYLSFRERITAETELGTYLIFQPYMSPFCTLVCGDNTTGSYPSLVQAKNAAQTHYKHVSGTETLIVTQGMALAAVIVMHHPHATAAARAILDAAGIRKVEDVVAAGLTDYDVEILRPLLGEKQ